MTPQSSFMILAAATADPHRLAELRRLLASMNGEPGMANPRNVLVPFEEFEQLHFARFVILEDKTTGDIEAYNFPTCDYPTYLAFLGDFDGSAEAFFEELARKAGDGLRQIFSYCEGFSADADLLGWLKAKNVSPAANYVNWIGRTARQVREEESLRQTLESFIQENADTFKSVTPRQIKERLKTFVDGELASSRIRLTPEEPTPLGWRIRNSIDLVVVPLILIVLSPLLLLYLPFFLLRLHGQEKSDPVIAPRVDPAHASLLASIEDRGATNQFSAMGSLKPGLFRRWTTIFVLRVIDYGAKHIYNRGNLARVTTIQFARWVFLDGKKRVIFCSNYDGSLEGYMDDFINKVAFGLNVVFSNGVGYPKTNWLIQAGAKDEQTFKYFLRRHQLPTEVWYNAHQGLTAHDKKRNALIREGLEQSSMSDLQIEEWLRLF